MRVLTSVVLIPTVTWLILFAPQPVFQAAVSVFALLCWHEFAGLAGYYNARLVSWHGWIPGLLILYAGLSGTMLMTVIILGALAAALRNRELREGIPATAFFALGLIYAFGAWRAAVELRVISPYWVLFANAINWVGDSAAYFVGRAVGKRKLAPRISPGKSVEGAVASVLFASAFGVLFVAYFLPGTPWTVALGVSVAGNVAGQIGDLAESALKRGAGVKVSGTLLPGHGGWLDRLDSSLFSMPITLFVLTLIR